MPVAYWVGIDMSSIIESEFKSRLFDVNCQRHQLMTYHCFPSILLFLLTSTSKINYFYFITYLKRKKKQPQTMMVKVLIDE